MATFDRARDAVALLPLIRGLRGNGGNPFSVSARGFQEVNVAMGRIASPPEIRGPAGGG